MGFILPEKVMEEIVRTFDPNDEVLDAYARRYVDELEEMETLKDYCEQAALDLGGDRATIVRELKAKIRRLKMRLV